MKNEELYDSDGLVFGDMSKWVEQKAGIEYVYKKVADLIRQGKDPDDAQAEVLAEMGAMQEGLVLAEDQASVSAVEE